MRNFLTSKLLRHRIGINLILILSLCGPLYPQHLAYANMKQERSNETRALNLILEEIKDKYSINFVYEPHLVQDREVSNFSLGKSSQSLTELLRQLLPPHGLTYEKITAKDYIIKKNTQTSENSDKTQSIVKGKVISSEDLSGIPGVNVLIKGTATGAITDIDGNYSLEISDNNAVLIFSYIGFKNQEVSVNGQSTINITLEPDAKQLNEVVVTAVGIESGKASLGYSVNNIDVETLVKAKEANIVSAMSGKVAGVQVISSSGSPGASATIRIRGSRSMTGSNGPLFVIDGVPVSNSSSGNGSAGVDNSNRAIDINPNDIAKISILKGPSATVLYGSRAANGAVMITTKNGKKGEPKITFNSSFGMSEVNKLPPVQNLYAQGRPDGGIFQYRGPETGENNSWGPLISELEFDGDKSYPYDQNGKLVPVGSGNGTPAKAYDKYSSFFVKGYSYDNNLSVSGGNDAVRYYFSIGNLYQTGVVPNADFSRSSIKSNLQADLTDKLSAGVSATFVNSGGSRIQRGSNSSGFTVGLFRNTPTFDIGNGKVGKEAANDPSTYVVFPDNTQRSYRGNGGYDNPFWVVNKNPYSDNVNRMIGNVSLQYELLPWLKLSYKIGVDYFTDNRDFAWDVNSSSQTVGRVGQSVRLSNRINSDILVLINKDINEDLFITATFGHNYFDRHFESKTSLGSNFSIPGFFDISNALELESSRSISNEKVAGLFGDVKFGYKNTVYLNLSARNDWSSTLPKNSNSLLYPAAAIGFEFTELLPNFKNILSYGKARVSYGKVGNTPSVYQTETYYETANIDGDNMLAANEFPFNESNGFERSGRKGNKEIRPEFTTTLEYGIDLKLLDGRISLDATYYKAFTEDAIVTITLSAPSGYTSIQRNAGDIENKGFEFSLSGVPIENTNGLNWETTLTFTRNRSLIKALPDDVESINLASFSALSSANIVGQPYGVLRGTRYKRDSQGRMVIGSDGWPLMDVQQGVIGDPNPDWVMGINNNFSYKGVQLSFLWDIKEGGDMWNGTKGVLDYLGVSKESGDQRTITGHIFDGVVADSQGEPTEAINTTPVDFANPALGLTGIRWRKAGTLLGLAEDNIEDTSWIRLREVTVGYNFSFKNEGKAKAFRNASVSIYGRNLLLFTDYTGIDPETNLRGPGNAQGWDYFNMPNTKGYGMTLKLIFQ